MKVIIDKRHINPEFWSDDLVEITSIKKCDVGPNHLFYSIYVRRPKIDNQYSCITLKKIF